VNGNIVFKGKKNLDKGVYFLLSQEKGNYFDFIVDEQTQKQQITSDKSNLLDNLKAVGSKQNENFFNYIRFVTTKNKEFDSFGVTEPKSEYSTKTKQYHFNGIKFDSPGMSLWQVNSLWAAHKVKMDYNKAEHKLLKLDKIIVVKNKDIPINFGYSNPNEAPPKVKSVVNLYERIHIQDQNGFEFWDKPYASVYNSSWSGEYYNNVLDNGDVDYYFPNIQSVSSKIIEFDHNYDLAKGTPNTINSTYGRLTLNKLTYKGKNGVQVLPPYNFEYENPTQIYDINKTDDWGFNKDAITAWNLNKITDPNGANILINYEADDYYTEAVNYETTIKNGLKFTFYQHSGKLRFDVKNLNENNINKVINTYQKY